MRKNNYKSVPLDEIRITKSFSKRNPSLGKIIRKTARYVSENELPDIVIDENNILRDGYISYLIMQALGFGTVVCLVIDGFKTKKKEESQNEQNADG